MIGTRRGPDKASLPPENGRVPLWDLASGAFTRPLAMNYAATSNG